jgi:hypothetical protein
MGTQRKIPISDAQVVKRLAAGQSQRKLASEFGVARRSIQKAVERAESKRKRDDRVKTTGYRERQASERERERAQADSLQSSFGSVSAGRRARPELQDSAHAATATETRGSGKLGRVLKIGGPHKEYRDWLDAGHAPRPLLMCAPDASEQRWIDAAEVETMMSSGWAPK